MYAWFARLLLLRRSDWILFFFTKALAAHSRPAHSCPPRSTPPVQHEKQAPVVRVAVGRKPALSCRAAAQAETAAGVNIAGDVSQLIGESREKRQGGTIRG